MSLQSELRRLYEHEMGARECFDVLASYANRITASSVDTIRDYSGQPYERVMTLMKHLAKLELGDFRIGRHGKKTRFIWAYSPRSIGEVAQGKNTELDSYEGNEPAEEEEKPELGLRHGRAPGDMALSGTGYAEVIASAKQLLAERLNLKLEQIDITIRH
ncbi:hypothetical protein [Lichenihabitans psoromatis]|uniref:hypothetical protein n=1 Tax=Lichenihabitans psoromatis TaxID=2528642 RepID=UPI0010367EDD|nr:hypothetical protein [Lichenihabitans psoromatis]